MQQMTPGGPQGNVHVGAGAAMRQGTGGMHQPVSSKPAAPQLRRSVPGAKAPAPQNPVLMGLLRQLPPPRQAAPGAAVLAQMAARRGMTGGR